MIKVINREFADLKWDMSEKEFLDLNRNIEEFYPAVRNPSTRLMEKLPKGYMLNDSDLSLIVIFDDKGEKIDMLVVDLFQILEDVYDEVDEYIDLLGFGETKEFEDLLITRRESILEIRKKD